MNLTDGIWLLPSRGRPKSIARFFQAARSTGITSAGVVICGDPKGEGRDEYFKVFKEYAPANWKIDWFEPTEKEPIQSYGGSLREWMHTNDARWRSLSWLGVINDDQVPVTKEWDRVITGRLNGKNWITTNDLIQGNHRAAGIGAYSIGILKAVGYLYPPKMHHHYQDDLWENLGRATGIWDRAMDIVIAHAHWSRMATHGYQSDIDDTAKLDLRWDEQDKALFAQWCKSEFMPACERIKTYIRSFNGESNHDAGNRG